MVIIALCGLVCIDCDIRLAPRDSALAARLTQSFIDMGHAGAEPDWFHCAGCPARRVDHWSADCGILLCCVDEHSMACCNECSDFVCAKLEEWDRRSPRF